MECQGVEHLEVDYLPPEFLHRVRIPFYHLKQAPTMVGPFVEDIFSHKDLSSGVHGLKGDGVGLGVVYSELGWDRDKLQHLVILTIRESLQIRRGASRVRWGVLGDMRI